MDQNYTISLTFSVAQHYQMFRVLLLGKCYFTISNTSLLFLESPVNTAIFCIGVSLRTPPYFALGSNCDISPHRANATQT
jgi:hypothetical protein